MYRIYGYGSALPDIRQFFVIRPRLRFRSNCLGYTDAEYISRIFVASNHIYVIY